MGGSGNAMDMNSRIRDNRRLMTDVNNRYKNWRNFDFGGKPYKSKRKKAKIKPLTPERIRFLRLKYKRLKRIRFLKAIFALFIALSIILVILYFVLKYLFKII